MSNPLLMHTYFKSKVVELMDRYKIESLQSDTSAGAFRDLGWSQCKRDHLVPKLLAMCEKKSLEEAADVSRYNDEFRSKLNEYLEYCNWKRGEFNKEHKKSLGLGDLETVYVDRIVCMNDHLAALYEVYNIGSTKQNHILGKGNTIAYKRNQLVQELFATLYSKPKMDKEDYEYINGLIKHLEATQEAFETEFEASREQMQSTQGDEKINETALQAFKDTKYDLELAKALKNYKQLRYEAAVSISRTTFGAYLGFAAEGTASLLRWFVADAGTALYHVASRAGESFLDWWVQQEGPALPIMNATSATGNTFLTAARSSGGGSQNSVGTIIQSTDQQLNRVTQ